MPINKKPKPGYKMAPGKMYAGGSANFNEATGTYRSTGTKSKRKPPVMGRIKKK